MNPSWFIPNFDPMTFSGNPRCQRRVGHLFCQRPTAFAWDLPQSCAPLTKGFPLVRWKSPIKNGAWEMVGKFLEVNVGFSIYPLDLISLCSKNTNPQHFSSPFSYLCKLSLCVFLSTDVFRWFSTSDSCGWCGFQRAVPEIAVMDMDSGYWYAACIYVCRRRSDSIYCDRLY